MNTFPISVVDVGASKGLFAEHVLKANKTTCVYAVEPNMKVNLKFLQELEKRFPSRIKIFPYALANCSGFVPFYGADFIEGQIGSLFPLNMNSSKLDLISLDKSKFQVANTEYVPAKTVKEFIEDIGSNNISFLKIDAQGSDVEILRAFLGLIQIDCIVLEVDTLEHSTSNLYNINNSFDKLIELISKYSLKIIKMIPNSDLSEFNVFLATNIQKANNLILDLDIYNSLAFGKCAKVIGINHISQKKPNSKHPLIKKVILGLRHPHKSLISAYWRLSR